MFKAKNRVYFYLAILLVLIVFLGWQAHMPGQSYDKDFPALTTAQKSLALTLKEHVVAIASEPHNTEHLPALAKSAAYIESQLKSDGYVITQQFFIEDRVHNIAVSLEPTGKVTQTVIIGAHYDSAGAAVGANDNGSGVATLLELAKRFKTDYHSEHTRLRLVFFVNEEPPFFKTAMMGSAHYARLMKNMNEPIVAMFAFDELGHYSEEKGSQHYPWIVKPFYPSRANFIGFVGNITSRPLVTHTIKTFRDTASFPSQGIAGWQYIPGIDYSDHLSFYLYGWQAIMITDTAFNRYAYYHTPQDTPDKINYDRLAQLTDDLEVMFRKMYGF